MRNHNNRQLAMETVDSLPSQGGANLQIALQRRASRLRQGYGDR